MNSNNQIRLPLPPPPASPASVPLAEPAVASAPNETDQFVSAARLLQLLFPEDSRPSERWLRRMVIKSRIPAIRVGGRVWYQPNQVRASLLDFKKPAGRPKGSKNKPKADDSLLGEQQ